MLFALLALASAILPYASTAAIQPEGWNSLQTLSPRDAGLDSSQCTCPNTRTLVGVIWSCLATIFICTWVAIHPNLPPPGEKQRRNFLRGCKTMFWGLIGPELILSWSVRQWLAAREISRDYKSRGWTMTHGFFLIMGGFVLVKGEEDLGTISIELLKELDSQGEIEFPSLTREEIEDKSKGDGLAKGLAVIQVLWFIIQTIARGVQGLALTELELVTLAFSSLNAAMYYFWWYKPLGVKVRVPIHLKPSSDFMHKRELQRRGGIADVDLVSREIADVLEETSETQQSEKTELDHPPSYLLGLGRSFQKGTKKFKRKIGRQIDHVRMRMRRDLRDNNTAFVLLFWWPIALPCSAVYSFLRNIFYLIGSSEDNEAEHVKPGTNRVPTFYSPSPTSRSGTTLVFGTFGTLFGALHCIAWNFQFPTHAEQVLWRVLSLFITIPPLAMLILFAVLGVFFPSRREFLDEIDQYFDSDDSFGTLSIFSWILVVVAIVVAILLLVYIPARLILLFQAFFSLRKLPSSALLDISWGDFIPHF